MLSFIAAPAPAAPTSGDQKTGGKGSEGKGASVEAVLKKMVPMLVNLDRRVGALDDRSTIAIVIRDEDWKVKLSGVRVRWQTFEKERRTAHDATNKSAEETEKSVPASQTSAATTRAASSGVEVPSAENPLAGMDEDEGPQIPGLAPHPMGGSQRAVMWQTIMELIETELPSDNPVQATVKAIRAWTMENTAKIIFRARPRNYTYAVGKPWIWGFMLDDSVDANVWRDLRTLYEAKSKKFFCAQQLTKDGPNAKWLLDWVKDAKGDGNGSKGDESTNNKKKRGH